MISYIYASLLSALIAIDLLISIKLVSIYRIDHDIRKTMFTIGILMCIPIYAGTIFGANNFESASNIFYWSPLPILMAFIFTLLNYRFNLNLKIVSAAFSGAVALTLVLYFVPFQINSIPYLTTGLIFAMILAGIQSLTKFDVASGLLFISMPCFAVCFIGLGYNSIELGIFAAFTAKGSLILAYEEGKKQEGFGSSVLGLKNS